LADHCAVGGCKGGGRSVAGDARPSVAPAERLSLRCAVSW
jgi:hypothetical protein